MRIRWIRWIRRIFWKLRHETNPRNESFENGWIRNPRYETNPDSWSTSRYESMDSRNESTFLRISYTIPASLHKMYHITGKKRGRVLQLARDIDILLFHLTWIKQLQLVSFTVVVFTSHSYRFLLLITNFLVHLKLNFMRLISYGSFLCYGV